MSKNIGREWEHTFAKKTNSWLTPGSGNRFHAKMDVEDVGKFLWSLKATNNKSTRFNLAELMRECNEEAIKKGVNVIPGLALRHPDDDYIVLRLDDLLKLFKGQIEIGKETRADAVERLSDIPELLRDDSGAKS